MTLAIPAPTPDSHSLTKLGQQDREIECSSRILDNDKIHSNEAVNNKTHSSSLCSTEIGSSSDSEDEEALNLSTPLPLTRYPNEVIDENSQPKVKQSKSKLHNFRAHQLESDNLSAYPKTNSNKTRNLDRAENSLQFYHFLGQQNNTACPKKLRSNRLRPNCPSQTNLSNNNSQINKALNTSVIDGIRFQRSETLILFDWDDTLLPSSWLADHDLTLEQTSIPTKQEQIYLDTIALTVSSLLISAVHCGRVVIVTNAESGWVDLSAAKFMPTVLSTLRLWHISIISARSEFEAPKFQHPVQWKVEAFRHLLVLAYSDATSSKPKNKREVENTHSPETKTRCSPDGRKNVLSFGDSDSERIALIQCVRAMKRMEANNDQKNTCLYKSFKLCEHPTPTILQRQLQLIQKLLFQIVCHSGNLDLRINFRISHTSDQSDLKSDTMKHKMP